MGHQMKDKQFIGLLLVDGDGKQYVVDGPYIPDGVDFARLHALADEQEFPFMVPEFEEAWNDIETQCIVDEEAYDAWLENFDEWIESGE